MRTCRAMKTLVHMFELCLLIMCVGQSLGSETTASKLPSLPTVKLEAEITEPEVLCFVTHDTSLRYSALATHEGNSILDGGFTVLDSNTSVVVRGTYADGSLNGPLTTYHANGRTASLHKYDRGLLTEVGMHFGQKGELRRISHYRDGQKMGFETYFAEDGTPSMIIEWGRYVKSVRIYSSGVLTETYEGEEAREFIVGKLLPTKLTP